MAVLGLLQVYWLDVDYLEVAGAALHCSASMTALLYVEEWCKLTHHGQLTMGTPAGGGAEQVLENPIPDLPTHPSTLRPFCCLCL